MNFVTPLKSFLEPFKASTNRYNYIGLGEWNGKYFIAANDEVSLLNLIKEQNNIKLFSSNSLNFITYINFLNSNDTISKLSNLLDYYQSESIIINENLEYTRLNLLLMYPDAFHTESAKTQTKNNNYQLSYSIPKYINAKNKSLSGNVEIHYREKGHHGIGRKQSYSSDGSWFCSSAGFASKARHLMYYDKGYDIDMENCHPRLLRYMMHIANLPHTCIDIYINNRNTKLTELMDLYKCNRSEAKNLALRLCYGGSISGWMIDLNTTIRPPSFWDSFNTEIIGLKNILMQLQIWNDTPESSKNNPSKEDIENSKLSYVAQHLEKKALLVMCNTAKKYNANIYALCFDGLIISKSVGCPNNFAIACQRDLEVEFPGLNMIVTVKEMNCPDLPAPLSTSCRFNLSFISMLGSKTKYDREIISIESKITKATGTFNNFKRGKAKSSAKEEITNLTQQLQDFNEKIEHESYSIKKIYFEEFHGKILAPLNYYQREFDNVPITYKITDFEHLLANVRIKMNDKIIPFTTRWFTDIEILSFSKVDFLPPPLKCDTHILNNFTGYIIQKYQCLSNTSTERINNHIQFLCNNDTTVYTYMKNWLAHMIQFPGKIPGVAIVIKSKPGFGKSLFFEKLGRNILGSQYIHATALIDQITGRFSELPNKVLIILDESNSKDSFANSNILKNLITQDKYSWERKGLQPITVNNVARFIFLSNMDLPVKIEQSDRRYMVVECTQDKPSHDYFDKLAEDLCNLSVLKTFYNELATTDLSNWDPRNYPITEACSDIQNASRPIIHDFMDYFIDLTVKDKDDTNYYIDNANLVIKSTYIRDLYKTWLFERQLRAIPDGKFAIEIKHVPGFVKFDRSYFNGIRDRSLIIEIQQNINSNLNC